MISLAFATCTVLSAVLACPLQDAASGAAAVASPPGGKPTSYGRVYLDGNPAAVAALDRGELDPASLDSFSEFCDKFITKDDPLVTAVDKGIIWYGVWEDAIAEVQRTGKPLFIHIGSPRVMQVCGVW